MKKNTFLPSEIKEIENKRIYHSKGKNFFSCEYCLKQFTGSSLSETMTPRDYGMYEASNYSFTYPNGEKSDIVVVWCKRCGNRIWDSRDLVKAF